MTQEEFKRFVKSHDRQVGIYEATEQFKEKREERIANVPDKVLFMAQWLKDNNIDFQVFEALTYRNKHLYAMLTDIYIPSHNIAMRYVDEDSEKSMKCGKFFYNFMFRKTRIFFIRSHESDEFLAEKIGNCLKMKIRRNFISEKNNLVRQKRARVTIQKFEKI